MPCPSTLRSAPLCLCETTPFHAVAMLLSATQCHRLTFLTPPHLGCSLHCCSMPLRLRALPLRLRAVYCLASALHRFVSPCIALALPCVAVPLRFTAVLCYATAIPRSNLPRPGNSSLFNATAMSRFSSLCPRISLHSLAFANRRVLHFAFATHRQSNRRRSLPWLIHAMPQHFITSQCHSNSIQPNAIAKLLLAVQRPRCTVPFTAKPLRYTAIRAVAYSTIS